MADNLEGGGLISEIVSQAAYKQIADLIAQLSEANTAIGKLAQTSKTVEFQFKGAETLAQLSTLIKEATNVTNNLSAATKSYADSTAQMAAVQKDYANTLGQTATQVQTLQAAVNTATSAIKSNDTATAQAAQSVIKIASETSNFSKDLSGLSAQLAAQRTELSYVTTQMNGLNKAIMDGSGSMEDNEAYLAKMTLRQQELKVEISATTSAIKTEIKENYAATGSIDELSQALFQLKERYRALSAAERENEEVGGVLLTEINALDLEVKRLDATIGNNQRNVGNYSGAFKTVAAEISATKAKMQEMVVAGEQSSAEYAKLQARAIELSAAQREVATETGRATFSIENITKRLETMGFRMLIHMAVFTLIIEGAQKLYEWWTKDAKAAEEMEKTMKSLGDTAQQNALKEMSNVQLLASIAKDSNESMSIRIRAIDELQSKYPDYLGNLSQEALLTGNTADEMDRLNAALMNKAFAEAAQGKVSELAKKFIELNDQMKEFEKENPSLNGIGKDNIIAGPQSGAGDMQKAELQKQFNERKKVIQNGIDDIKRQMQIYQDEANNFAGKAGGLFVGSNKNNTKTKTANGYGTELKGENDLSNAKFLLKKEQLAIDMENQRAIFESEKFSLDARKDALKKFYDDEVELAKITMVKEISINDNTTEELKKKLANDKNLSAAARKGIEDSIEAGVIKNIAASEKYSATIAAAQRKFGSDIINIEKSNTNYKNNIIKEDADKEIEARGEVYATDLKNLVSAYQQKKLTTEEYNKQLLETQNKFNEDVLKIGIEKDNKELANLQEGSAEYIHILEDRNKKEIALINASADTYKKGKKDPFEGDLLGSAAFSLTKALSPNATEDKQISAAKKMKELTIQLAQETANAIITIEENKFKAIQQDLDRQSKRIELNKTKEIDAINATAGYSTDKARKIAEINARTAAQESELDAKKRNLAVQQARFEKEAAIGKIMANTAVSIIKLYAEFDPFTASVLAGIVGAIGAAQLAAAASAPIPAYKHGTTGTPRSEYAIVGDGGERELITNPDGSSYWSSDKPEVRYLSKGTKVTPESKLLQFAQSNVTTFGYGTKDKDRTAEIMAAYVSDGFAKVGKGIESAISQNKTNVIVNVISNERYQNDIKRI